MTRIESAFTSRFSSQSVVCEGFFKFPFFQGFPGTAPHPIGRSSTMEVDIIRCLMEILHTKFRGDTVAEEKTTPEADAQDDKVGNYEKIELVAGGTSCNIWEVNDGNQNWVMKLLHEDKLLDVEERNSLKHGRENSPAIVPSLLCCLPGYADWQKSLLPGDGIFPRTQSQIFIEDQSSRFACSNGTLAGTSLPGGLVTCTRKALCTAMSNQTNILFSKSGDSKSLIFIDHEIQNGDSRIDCGKNETHSRDQNIHRS